MSDGGAAHEREPPRSSQSIGIQPSSKPWDPMARAASEIIEAHPYLDRGGATRLRVSVNE
jgi:hypothetical protein